MDAISETRLALVHPLLADKVRAMADALAAQGIVIRVVQGLRTFAEQNRLYNQGRTTPGEKVTNAIAGQSWHNYGFAVDCIPGLRGDDAWAPNWDAEHPDFQAMIEAGIAQGLVSGAKWIHMPDKPHFQLAGIPVSPDAAAMKAMADATSIGAEADASELAVIWSKYADVIQ
jgi:peptidoglycan L-alanyl-D-glutamate endopeptidase CwlK